MYQRFTERARTVMQLANQEAQRFNHEYLGTEHILLGLIKEGSGVAASVIKSMGGDLRKCRLSVEKLMRSGPEMVTMGKLPSTPRAKKAIEYAAEEREQLFHNFVGTEHILLGLLNVKESKAAKVLNDMGMEVAEVRTEVLNILGNKDEKDPKDVESLIEDIAPSRVVKMLTRRLLQRFEVKQAKPIEVDPETVEKVFVALTRRKENSVFLLGSNEVVGLYLEAIARTDYPFCFVEFADAVFSDNPQPYTSRVSRLLEGMLQSKSSPVVFPFFDRLFKIEIEGRPVSFGELIQPWLKSPNVQFVAFGNKTQWSSINELQPGSAHQFTKVELPQLTDAQAQALTRRYVCEFERYHACRFDDVAVETAIAESRSRFGSSRGCEAIASVLDNAGAKVRLLLNEEDEECMELDRKIASAIAVYHFSVAKDLYQNANSALDTVGTLSKRREEIKPFPTVSAEQIKQSFREVFG